MQSKFELTRNHRPCNDQRAEVLVLSQPSLVSQYRIEELPINDISKMNETKFTDN